GMCVIGAGRRASRGEDVRAILAQYYPGLNLVTLEAAAKAPEAPAAAAPAANPSADAREARGVILVRVPPRSTVTATNLERMAARAHAELSKTLGTSMAPITIQLHESVESFRLAT